MTTTPAPDQAPRNPVRGCPLADRESVVAGDPATDLAGFFLMGLFPGEWEGFEASYGPVGPDTVLGTLGWAVALDSAVQFARHRGLV